jgi:hypothetical protein
MQQKTIDVSIPHRLGKAEAKARLQAGTQQLRTKFGPQLAQVNETWVNDHADFAFTVMGQSLTGRLDVEDAAIKVSVDVPWMLAMLADKVRGKIEQEGRRLLEKK